MHALLECLKFLPRQPFCLIYSTSHIIIVIRLNPVFTITVLFSHHLLFFTFKIYADHSKFCQSRGKSSINIFFFDIKETQEGLGDEVNDVQEAPCLAGSSSKVW